jgi:mono/diheme cytochrome c family protein
MTVQSLTRNRAIILLAILVLSAAASLPFIVSAQDASPAAASPVDPGDPVLVRGEEIFNNVCIACHQPDGKGVEGIYLPLAGNPLVTLEDPTYLITVILNGRGGMPRFDTTYSDEDIASIASYVRQAWDNDAEPVTAEQVAEVRASFAPPAVNTPVGQRPEGTGRSTPEMNASPVASPVATPAA